MRIIHTDQSLPTDTLGQLAVYSGMDNLSLFEISDELQSLLREPHRHVYSFEMLLHAPLFEMAKNGLHVDVPMREQLIREYTAQEAKISSHLHQLCLAIGYYEYYIQMARLRIADAILEPVEVFPSSWAGWLALPLSLRRAFKARNPKALAAYHKALKEFSLPFNGNSPAQKLRLFFDFFGHEGNTVQQELTPDFYPAWNKTRGISEIKTRTVSGDYTPGADRDVLERLQKKALEATPDDAVYWAQPFISCCLALADISKTLGFLRCKLEDGIFRYSFGAVTETGRLNSKANAQGYGCFPPGAEALTPSGWKPLEEISDGEQVMQWYPNGTMEWAPAKPYSTFFEGKLHNVHTEQTAFSVTPNHRLACEGYGAPHTFMEKTAAEVFHRSSNIRLKVSGKYDGTAYYPRLLIALLADGCLEHPETNYWRINFTKGRKISRFIKLAQEAGIAFKEVSAKQDYRRFSLNAPDSWPTDWGDWVLDLDQDCAEELLEETQYWDGVTRGKSFIFFTARKYRAKWVQTLAHLCGRGSTIVEKEQSAASWSDTLMYHVNVRPRDYASIEQKHKSYSDYSGQVYCLTVPSSYFLVRQFGKIFVTGNSNAQNVSPKNRLIFTTPLGWKFIAIDYGQIESRNVAAICYTLFGTVNYINATESGDLHSLAASMVWPELPWPEEFTIDHLNKYGPFPKDVLKAAKTVASKEFYRGKSRRDVSKTLGHGTSYMGRPPQMSKHSHIPVKLIEHYQAVFFDAFPEMQMWHQHVATQIQTTQVITTLFGRERRFLGRPTDDATLREAVAYEPQSMAADMTNTALTNLHIKQLYEDLPFRLVLQKHDELCARFPEEKEQEVISIFTSIMERGVTLTSPSGETRYWYVPAEAETGWNLGRMSEKNPDGLARPMLPRERQRNPFDLLGAQV